jgi:tRNA threonylcarbamoyladenosine biosynthesis protein TsaE
MLSFGAPFVSHSPEETIAKGRELAQRLTPPVLVLLAGELGSGKTTFTKGIVSGLGAALENEVTSPTFTLMHVFQHRTAPAGSAASSGEPAGVKEKDGKNCVATPVKVYHVDLYRIEGFADLETLGLEDALSESAIVIIEWPDRFSLRSDWLRISAHLEHLEGDSRRITISEPFLSENGSATALSTP